MLVQVKGVEESDVSPGFVLCCPTNPIKTGRVFDAQVRAQQPTLGKMVISSVANIGLALSLTLPLQVVMLDLKSIICAGFSCMLHLQAMAEEVGGQPAHPHTCTHAHMHTCTHAHMHTCTHAHMHTCTASLR